MITVRYRRGESFGWVKKEGISVFTSQIGQDRQV